MCNSYKVENGTILVSSSLSCTTANKAVFDGEKRLKSGPNAPIVPSDYIVTLLATSEERINSINIEKVISIQNSLADTEQICRYDGKIWRPSLPDECHTILVQLLHHYGFLEYFLTEQKNNKKGKGTSISNSTAEELLNYLLNHKNLLSTQFYRHFFIH